ncbi:hypothetical protein RvY_00795 [Ramazzottius varieornatus]|uniref:Uncharacterized protein n=1 Tax=Ramazzottius varieornatus TaxID=947166 RepID=A0A1D1UNT8_RAMVA|nr:hypothetical protein RvY_00795 [Ramazzottius varieornatus]
MSQGNLETLDEVLEVMKKVTSPCSEQFELSGDGVDVLHFSWTNGKDCDGTVRHFGSSGIAHKKATNSRCFSLLGKSEQITLRVDLEDNFGLSCGQPDVQQVLVPSGEVLDRPDSCMSTLSCCFSSSHLQIVPHNQSQLGVRDRQKKNACS